jgi:peptidoglycan/xylan/chitin deacetylase (PgdA/CDA1 family)
MTLKQSTLFSLSDRHIIVNYHYVENPSPEFSGIYPCAVKEFEKQAKFLNENYKIVSVTSVVEAARSEKNDRLCAITFDDGLKDQYQYALPILKHFGIAAVFFPITSVWEGRLPTAHKTHVLLSKLSAINMIEVFHSFLKDFYPDLQHRYVIPLDRRLTSRRLHEDIATANMKEILITLPEDIKAQFLRFCFKKFHLDESAIADQLFMSKQEVGELKKIGMEVGNHSHSHYAFDVTSEDVIRTELQLSQGILKKVLGQEPQIFSYPHGRFSELVKKSLKEEKFQFGLTIERRGIKSDDESLLLPRYDTMDLKDFLELTDFGSLLK